MPGPYPFWTFFALAAVHNLILQCSNIAPTYANPFPRGALHRHSRMFPILLANLVSNALTPRAPRRRRQPPVRAGKGRAKPINLALQGGGAHGAFTWGVLDQLLDDGRLVIDGLSGTSAGALNAVVMVDGLARGGAEAARARLAEFWRAVSLGGTLPDLQRQVVER